MEQYDYLNKQLCRKCYIKLCRPSKNEIKSIVMTEYQDKCDQCGRISALVDYVEDQDR